VSKPSAKLRMVRDMISQRGIAMMAVTETRRVIRMEVEIVGDKTGTPMTVYGVYMTQRSGAAGEVDDVWQQAKRISTLKI